MGVHLTAPAKAESHIDSIKLHKNTLWRGLKRNEQLVYDALYQSRSPLKAYDLLEQLYDDGLKAPMTIYRALEALIAKDCVKKIESLNAFIALDFDRTTKAHAFLICRDCMQAKELKIDEQQVVELFAPMLVTAQDVSIEAFVDCYQVCGAEEKHE